MDGQGLGRAFAAMFYIMIGLGFLAGLIVASAIIAVVYFFVR